MSRPPGRVRRDGLPAMLLFLAAPFGALGLGTLGHPAGLLESEEEILERTERWRGQATPAAREAGVPPDLLLALVATESSGRPGAVSGDGARGLAQLLPATAEEVALGLGIPITPPLDLHDPALNLRLGAAYLGSQLRAFGGDESLALAAYNCGPNRVARWREGSPAEAGPALLRANATPKVRAYVERVLARRARLAAPSR